MDIKILVATHKKYQMPKEKIYLPLHVGREGKENLGYQGDNTGENISLKNPYYSELTGLFWAWKNLDNEYIGLVHYRRYFTNKNLINRLRNNNKFNLVLSKSDIEDYLKSVDVIIPKKRNYYVETIWSHYANAHYISDLEMTKEIIKDKYPKYIQSFDKVMNGKKLHLYNMFIMNKALFNEYSQWVFDILFELEQRVDISNYDNYQKRIYGFISERLFNVWLDYKDLKTLELPVVNMEKVNWLDKIYKFVKRKLK